MRRVVITGLGPVSPIGTGKNAFWEAARRGVSGTGPLMDLPLGFAPDRFRARIAAAVPERFQSRNRHVDMGLAAADLGMRDANLTSLAARGTVVVGTAVGGTAPMEDLFFKIDAHPECSGELREAMSFHTLAAAVADKFESDQAPLTVSTGCTAGLDAVGIAFEMIRDGDIDVALAGASDAPLTPVVFAAFDVIGALSTRNDRATTASRPFDAGRDGFVLGEGSAFLLLEEREVALRRGARVYAEIRSFASICNGYHMTDLPEDGADLSRCIDTALDGARLKPDEIDAVNAHGSSTFQNDLCETNAIKRSLNGRARAIPVNSLKAMIGHALGASNAIEIAACALELRDQFVFPTLHFEEPGAGCDLDYVPNHGRRVPIRNLLKLSNGFSGIHSAMILSTAT